MSASSSAWPAANTNPNGEHIVLEHQQVPTACCPMIRRQRSRPRRTGTFPGDLLMQMETDVRWQPIQTALVGRTGDDPGSREVNGATVRPPGPYRARQGIKIAGNPFDRTIAAILALGEKGCLLASLGWLQRRIEARLGVDMTTPAYGSP